MSLREYADGPEVIDSPRVKPSETEILVREANHRIANSLAGIAGLVRLQAAEIGRERAPIAPAKVRELLREVSTRIESLGRLHRLLAHQDAGSQVDLGLHLGEVAVIVASTFEGLVLKNVCQGGCHVDAGTASTVALIVSEMITNSAKHAHPTGIPGEVTLSCSRPQGGSILIVVEDDGVGLPEGFDAEAGGGLGHKVIRALSTQIGAQLTLESHSLGLRSRLLLPSA